VSRLSRQCGIFSITKPYRPPLPVTEIALLFTFANCNCSYIHKQVTCRLSSRIEDRYYYPSPLPSQYRENLPTVDCSSSLKKKGVVPSETIGTIYHTTRRYISRQNRRRENPNSHNFRAISQFISKIDLRAMGLEEGWNKELALANHWIGAVELVACIRLP
jgi:hypothetical protein